MSKEHEEIEVCGMNFRIQKERNILSDGLIDKIVIRDGAIGTHELIKIDFEILQTYPGKAPEWRSVTDFDLKRIKGIANKDLIKNKIKELRTAEKDFHKVQQEEKKEQAPLSG